MTDRGGSLEDHHDAVDAVQQKRASASNHGLQQFLHGVAR